MLVSIYEPGAEFNKFMRAFLEVLWMIAGLPIYVYNPVLKILVALAECKKCMQRNNLAAETADQAVQNGAGVGGAFAAFVLRRQ